MKIPNLNVSAFAKKIAISTSRRWCQNEIWPFLNNNVGEELVGQLIDADKPLFSVVLTQPNIPQSWKDKIAQAPQYAHYLSLITQEDVFLILPDWFKPLVLSKPNGIAWFQKECDSLKYLFGGI